RVVTALFPIGFGVVVIGDVHRLPLFHRTFTIWLARKNFIGFHAAEVAVDVGVDSWRTQRSVEERIELHQFFSLLFTQGLGIGRAINLHSVESFVPQFIGGITNFFKSGVLGFSFEVLLGILNADRRDSNPHIQCGIVFR